jgi:hypothetical protein
MLRYFVSFATSRGFGNTEIKLSLPIRGMNDINLIHKLLRSQGADGPIVLHYIRLPDDAPASPAPTDV